MKTTVKLLNVDELTCRLTVEMTVYDLRKLTEQIDKAPDWLSWPLAGLREAAIDTIKKAETEFSTEIQSR
jgi:hypothetical protein